MRPDFYRLAVLLCALAGSGGAAAQSSATLPIPEGIWVEVGMSCAAATSVRVYDGRRFGNVYFYGPNQSMGPSDEREAVTHIGRGEDGFTIVNDGPVEVKALPGGQADIRAFSPVQGEVWRETARICPPASLSPRMRAATAR